MKQYYRILLEGGGEEKPLLLYIRKINLDLDMFTWSYFGLLAIPFQGYDYAFFYYRGNGGYAILMRNGEQGQ